MIDALAVLLAVLGIFFQVVGSVGFLRLPDVYCRMHVAGINDTLGSPLVMLAVAVHVGSLIDGLKIVLAIALLYFTSPLVVHFLGRAALERGIVPWDGAGPPPAAPEELP